MKLQQVQKILNWIRLNSGLEFSVTVYNDVYTINKYNPTHDDWSDEHIYGNVQDMKLELARKVFNITYSKETEAANESGDPIDPYFDIAIDDLVKDFLKEEFEIIIREVSDDASQSE